MSGLGSAWKGDLAQQRFLGLMEKALKGVFNQLCWHNDTACSKVQGLKRVIEARFEKT